MVGTLRRAGFAVRVWNRTAARADDVARTHGRDRRRHAPPRPSSGADVVLSSLADDEAVLQTYLGDEGSRRRRAARTRSSWR